ncbi:hypothetical protein RCC89_20555 [Cytophagaceae bacterium ABcell3]|nr:hypothetical protein RCC89_20555 [Cytophagaceae bacterium ABcell3]
MLRPVKLVLLLIISGIGILIFLKSLDYYSPDFTRGYLLGKKEIFDGLFKYGLYAHIITAPFVLFIGIFRYSSGMNLAKENFIKL